MLSPFMGGVVGGPVTLSRNFFNEANAGAYMARLTATLAAPASTEP
jgi:hypothetical protein